MPSHLAAKEEGSDTQDHSHRWKHEPFDFSSKFGWDNFYKNGLNEDVDSTTPTRRVGEDESIDESLEYEWHAHIPHSAVVEAVEPSISAASKHYSKIQSASNKSTAPSILLVGCGNSALPRILHDAFDVPVRVTCLDYSPVCIEMIKSMYESSCPNMDFVVGDALRLDEVIWDPNSDAEKQSAEKKHFDVIVDKGLLDALMCGEGFDLEKLMGSTNSVLTPRDWGMHVLICFQLSKASKESLNELGNGNDPNLYWDFNIPVEGSENGRACFNLAQRCRQEDARGLVISQIATEWV